MATANRNYRNAVTRMLRATGLNSVPEAALLVATLKDLAEQLDNGAGGRVMTAWISAQTKLQRFLDGRAERVEKKPVGRPKKAPVEPEPVVVDEKPNNLVAFKRKHGIAS